MLDEIRHLVIATAVQETLIKHLLADSWGQDPEPLEAAKAFSEDLLTAEEGMKEPMAEDLHLEMTEMFHSIVDGATALLRRKLDRR